NREGFGVATGVDDQVTPAPRYAAHFGVELDQVAECSGEWFEIVLAPLPAGRVRLTVGGVPSILVEESACGWGDEFGP
ncbi:hypothetical protein, partial [Klebsiella pneumoniae]|uniref:hypothetical protein n=1 Tax=Klebsiella pneumoniae TaxID=573 RepID=UPI0027302505